MCAYLGKERGRRTRYLVAETATIHGDMGLLVSAYQEAKAEAGYFRYV